MRLETIVSDWLDTPEMPKVRRKKQRSILRCLVNSSQIINSMIMQKE